MNINPTDIRFSHDSINSSFSCGRNIGETYRQIRDGDIRVGDLPIMEVAPLNGSWFAWSGNRRLWVIQRLQSEGHIAEVLVLPTQKSISSRNYKLSTKNGGMSVRVRGVLQMSAIGGERIGWSMQQANSTRPGKETEKEQTAGVFIVQWIGSNTEPLKHNCQATKEQVMKCTDEEYNSFEPAT